MAGQPFICLLCDNIMKIRIWCRTHDTQSEVSEVFEVGDVGVTVEEVEEMSKKTEEHLESVAEQFMWEEKQPEYGFEVLRDDET